MPAERLLSMTGRLSAERTRRKPGTQLARRIVALVAVLVLIFAVVGVVAYSGLNQKAPTRVIVESPIGYPQGAPSAVAKLQSVTSLPGAVYNLTFDASRNMFWWTYMSGDASADSLNEFDPSSGRIKSWQLPGTDHNGFLEQVAVAPDGSIWLTEEYQILRLDPSLNTVKAVTLAIDDQDAVPDALDEDSPSPGTWPSAIAFDPQGRAVIARHNIAALSILDDRLDEVARIALPSGLYGPNSLATNEADLFVTSYAANRTVELRWDGTVVVDTKHGFAQIVAASGSVVAPASGGMLSALTSADTSLAAASGGPNDRVASGGKLVATYDSGTRSIQWFGATDPTVRLGALQLPMSETNMMNPLGKPVTVLVADEIGAIAVDSGGSIWIVNNSAHQLLRLY